MSDQRKNIEFGGTNSVARAIAHKIKTQEYCIPYPKLTEAEQQIAAEVASASRRVSTARFRADFDRFSDLPKSHFIDKDWISKFSKKDIYIWAISGQHDVFYDLLDPEYREDPGPRTLVFGVTAEDVEARKALLVAVLEEGEETERGRTR